MQKQIYVPTSLAKFISSELVRAGLSETLPDYNATLLQYITEIEHSGQHRGSEKHLHPGGQQYSEQDEETVASIRPWTSFTGNT